MRGFWLIGTGFLTAVIVIGGLQHSANALPAHLVKDDPAVIATFHCRQIYADESRLLTPDSLNQLAGDGNLAQVMLQDELDRIRREFGMAPDFGFLLEGRWQALTRDERQRFNQLFAAALRTHYHLQQNGSTIDKCHAKSLTPVENGAPVANLRYARTALTLEEANGSLGFIPLLYQLRKQGGNMWQIEDIRLGSHSLKNLLAKQVPDAITHGGFAGVLEELETIADGGIGTHLRLP